MLYTEQITSSFYYIGSECGYRKKKVLISKQSATGSSCMRRTFWFRLGLSYNYVLLVHQRMYKDCLEISAFF